MPRKIHAEIPLSFFEYQASYSEPLLDVARLGSEVLQAVFRALRRFGASLENVTPKPNPANLSEVGATFSLFGGRLSFTVRLGSVALVLNNPNWSEEGTITEIVRSGVGAVLSSSGVTLETQRASLVMHVKPVSGSIKDLVLGLSRPTAKDLIGEEVQAYGMAVHKEASTWVVDRSVLLAEALFVRIDEFGSPTPSFEELASRLRADEVKLLELLGLEID